MGAGSLFFVIPRRHGVRDMEFMCVYTPVCASLGLGGRAVMVQMGQHMTCEGVGTLRLSPSIWTPLWSALPPSAVCVCLCVCVCLFVYMWVRASHSLLHGCLFVQRELKSLLDQNLLFSSSSESKLLLRIKNLEQALYETLLTPQIMWQLEKSCTMTFLSFPCF